MISRSRLLSATAAGTLTALALLPVTAAQGASPDVAYGVTSNGNRLVVFDPSAPGAAGQGTAITGLGSGETVVGIDTSAGTLFALTDNSSGVGHLYSVATATAVATAIPTSAAINLLTDPSTDKFDIDVNPCSLGIRIVGSNNINLRLGAPAAGSSTYTTITDTNLTYASSDTNKSSPVVGGAAYSNAVTPASGSCTTTLYDADFSANTLDKQGSTTPNDGVLSTIGGFGVDPQSLLGLDVGSTGTLYLAAQVANSKGVSSSSTQLYSVNPSTGAATPVSGNPSVGSDLLSTFAVGPASVTPTLPEFGSPAMALGGGIGVFGLVLTLRRRRSTQA